MASDRSVYGACLHPGVYNCSVETQNFSGLSLRGGSGGEVEEGIDSRPEKVGPGSILGLLKFCVAGYAVWKVIKQEG